MTIFITETFKIDLTQLKIKFSDENSFFEKDLIKQYTFPFKIPKERSYIPFFEFISSHNSLDSNKYIQGTLFHNDKYYEAELMVVRISKQIEAVIYYSFQNLALFDRKLKSLPWEIITFNEGEDIFDFAGQRINENHPETAINFVKVYAPEKHKDYGFGTYNGFINDCDNGVFSEYYSSSVNFVVSEMNDLRPFIYIKKIVLAIFSEIGYTVSGDFMTESFFNKALQYHDHSIFYTNNNFALNEDLTVTLSESNISGYNPDWSVYNEYINSFVIDEYGTYSVNIELEGEFSAFIVSEFSMSCYFNNQHLGSTYASTQIETSPVGFNRTLNFDFDVDKAFEGESFEIRIHCTTVVKDSIIGEVNVTGTLRPLYRNFISLADLLPDITIGEYLNNLKETFVLTSVFNYSSQNVEFNLFNTFVENETIVDLTNYAVESVPRKQNKSTGYKIPFQDGEVVYLDKIGTFVTGDNGYTEKRIPLEPLPVVYLEAQPNVKHQEGLSMLFYEGNLNALPLVTDGDLSYSRVGFINSFLRHWYYQNLNSEEYNLTINLPIHISSKLNSKVKIWFYNNYFLVHSLKRENINNLFEKISLRLFKLINPPVFNLVIDDGSGNTSFEAPIIITAGTPGGEMQTEFETVVVTSYIGWTAPYINVNIFASASFDPQGLSLSYGWEVLSSPGGNAFGDFTSQNNDHSNTIFRNYGYTELVGDYFLRLTVINSAGVASIANLHVIVSNPSSPLNKIVLTKISTGDILNPIGKFSINFIDGFAPVSIVLNIQKFNITTQQNEGSPLVLTLNDLTQPFYEVTFPSTGSWKISATSGGEFSNTVSWYNGF